MKVSVKMITYNHEKYIRQAIDSVLMQQTDFSYELVIGEDCSTDGTREIIIDYQRRYPDKIRLLLSDQNLGMQENSRRTREACRGEYVALLEGDDYWTSPTKLQQQADFLDSHGDCVLCFHNVTNIYDGVRHGCAEFCRSDQPEISTLEDLLLTCFIPTASVMYRQGVITKCPDWYFSLAMADWPFFILHAQHGKIGYIREVLGAYRVHGTGVWSGMRYEKQLREVFQLYEAVNAHLEFKFDRIITKGKSDHVARLLVERIKSIPSLEDGTAIASQMLEEWSDLNLAENWKTKAMGRIYAYYLFSSHAERDRALGRRSFAGLLRNDPSWLLNPGVWSIAVEAFCGQPVGSLVRKLVRALLSIPRKQMPDQGEYTGFADGG